MHILRVLEKIRQSLRSQHIHEVLVVNPYDLFYLLGFSANEEGEGVLLITRRQVVFFTDGRYLAEMEKTARALKSIDFVVVDWSGERWSAVAERLDGGAFLGWDGTSSVNFMEDAKKALKLKTPVFSVVNEVVAPYRLIKTPDEIKLMRYGGLVMDNLFQWILENEVIQLRMTQCKLRGLINQKLRSSSSSDTLSFNTMVLFGENGESVHGRTEKNDRPLKRGDSVLIDCGIHLNGAHGLCTDATMTIFVGEPREEFIQAEAVLRRAMNNAFRWIRPGITGEKADSFVRGVMKKAGYDLIHGTGHGIGHECHEMPSLSSKNPKRKMILEEGMTFTIEPGIYSPFGAIRYEVFGMLTKDGFEPFNWVPLEPLEHFIVEL